jgi:hypothetical protein
MPKFFKTLIFTLLLCTAALGARTPRVWSSSGSTDGADGNNYTPIGTIQTTDSIILNNTSSVNWIPTIDLSCGYVNDATTYTGSITLNHKLTTDGSQLYSHTGNLIINDTVKLLNKGKFYIGATTVATCTNGTLALMGNRSNIDTIDIQRAFDSTRASFKNVISSQDTGSITYIVKVTAGPGIGQSVLCHHFWSIGCGTVIGTCAIDPDTAYFISYTPINNNYRMAFRTSRGLSIYNSLISKFNMERLMDSNIVFTYPASFTPRRSDTLIFRDSCKIAQLSFGGTSMVKAVVLFRNTYNNISQSFRVYTGGITDTVEMHFGQSKTLTSGFMNYGSAPSNPAGVYNLYLDTSNLIINAGWNYRWYGNDTILWKPGIGTVRFYPSPEVIDSVLTKHLPFYNVVCSTATSGGAVVVLDSAVINKHLNIKNGNFKTNYSLMVLGNFIDSTADSTVLSSLYIGGDAYFSSQTKLRWNAGSVLYAVGSGRQTFYTNGKSMPSKIICVKGTKLTIK